MGVQMRQMLLAAGIVAALIVAGCAQTQAALKCDYMSMGWMSDFNSAYLVTPADEAVQCDSDKGSVVVVKMPASDAANVEARMKGDMLSIGASSQASSYEKICSTSGSLCVTDWVVSGGKNNAVGMLDGNLVIIVVSSEKPEDAESFLESLWSDRQKVLQMLL